MKTKRLTAWIMAVLLCVSLLPGKVYAEEPNVIETEQEEMVTGNSEKSTATAIEATDEIEESNSIILSKEDENIANAEELFDGTEAGQTDKATEEFLETDAPSTVESEERDYGEASDGSSLTPDETETFSPVEADADTVLKITDEENVVLDDTESEPGINNKADTGASTEENSDNSTVLPHTRIEEKVEPSMAVADDSNTNLSIGENSISIPETVVTLSFTPVESGEYNFTLYGDVAVYLTFSDDSQGRIESLSYQGDNAFKALTVELEAGVNYSFSFSSYAEGIKKVGLRISKNNVTWLLGEDGTLTITGNGLINYGYNSPWRDNISDISSVVIGEGITGIGAAAFIGLSALTSIIMPSTLAAIADNAFYGCSGLTEIAIPESVQSLGANAFSNCSALKTVNMPGNMTVISGYAFSNCSALESIIVPYGITELSNGTFLNCSSLKSVVLPETITRISREAFAGCELMENINIPSAVNEIQTYAFLGCNSLKELTLPGALDSLASGSLENCVIVYYGGTKDQWEAIGGPDAVLEKCTVYAADSSVIQKGNPEKENQIAGGTCGIDLRWIVTQEESERILSISGTGEMTNYNFMAPAWDRLAITSVKFEEGITYLGHDALNNLKMDSLVLPESLTVIGNRVFTGGAMSKVVLPKSLTEVQEMAFYKCKNLQEILIPASVTTISDYAFGYIGYENGSYVPAQNFKIIGYKGTAAETYAKENGFLFEEAGNDESSTPQKQTITAKAAASSIAVGKTTAITTTGAQGKVTYKSADTSIATVSKTTGKITAQKVGTVKITVTAAATDNYSKATKTVTIKVLPAATTSVKTENTASGITVTWKKVTGATGYYIYRNGTRTKKISSGSTLTWNDTKATVNGKKYTYKVTAFASTGESTLSKSKTAYYLTTPTLSSVKSTATKQAAVKWIKNSKATGYKIQYSTSKSFASGNKTVTVAGATAVSKTLTKLTSGKTYYVRIRAFKEVGSTKYYSAWCTKESVKVK